MKPVLQPLYRASDQACLARQARVARTIGWRMRGMLGRRFDDFDALVFPRCDAIHTWFMAFPLDVLFLDRDRFVCGVRQGLPPWRLAAARRARTVIELPEGTLARTGIGLGDRIDFEP